MGVVYQAKFYAACLSYSERFVSVVTLTLSFISAALPSIFFWRTMSAHLEDSNYICTPNSFKLVYVLYLITVLRFEALDTFLYESVQNSAVRYFLHKYAPELAEVGETGWESRAGRRVQLSNGIDYFIWKRLEEAG